MNELDEDGQVDFKGKAKTFTRTYGFLAPILPYSNAQWENLSIFLNFLVPNLPAPKEQDLSKGILEAIDMDSHRVEKKSAMKIPLPEADEETEPVPMPTSGYKAEPELDRLTNILKTFNDQFGSIDWKDEDKIRQVITEEIPRKVREDAAYQNAMKNSDRQNARLEHDKALLRVMTELLSDHTELFKEFQPEPRLQEVARRYELQLLTPAGIQEGHVVCQNALSTAPQRSAQRVPSTWIEQESFAPAIEILIPHNPVWR